MPFSTIGMDITGPFPTSKRGNHYLLVFVDYATRFVEATAIPTQSAEDCAKAIIETIILRYGPPQHLISDRGTQFTSDLVKNITAILHVQGHLSSGYRPQTAGLVEHTNGILSDILAILLHAQHPESLRSGADWEDLLPYALFAYRTQYNEKIESTPFRLLYGYDPVLPDEIAVLAPDHSNPSFDAHHFATYINAARESAHNALKAAQHLAKNSFDKRHNHPPREYKPGDYVMLYKPLPYTKGPDGKRIAPNQKLKLRYQDPTSQ